MVSKGDYQRMRGFELINKINTGGFDRVFTELYGKEKLKRARDRYKKLIEAYIKRFGDSDIYLFSAPGRTEIGGNHTDHNNGHVLAAAVDLDVIAAVFPTRGQVITISSEGYPDSIVNIDMTSLEKQTDTGRLIYGVSAGVAERGYKAGGFNACITSDVPPGSGLSSSAAFENLICTIISHLYNNGRITATENALIGQTAENIYMGKPSGLMDQLASTVGGFAGIDFKYEKAPVIARIPFSLRKSGYTLCVVNTGGSHEGLTDEYASIPNEMQSVAGIFGKRVLRELTIDLVLENINLIRDKCGDRALLRALHFFDEDKRAKEQAELLQKGDFNGFLRLESGRSSVSLLQNIYVEGKPGRCSPRKKRLS
jgi:galactokinase